MSVLTRSFSAASIQENSQDSFLEWFLIFLFLEITDKKNENRMKKQKRRLIINSQNEGLRNHKIREMQRLKMSL